MENNNGWDKYAELVFAEIKRGNETDERLEKKIDSLDEHISKKLDIIIEKLTRHDVFIEEAKDKNIIEQVSHNSKFRNNTSKLIWKLVGIAAGSSGLITGVVNWIVQAAK